MLRVNPLFRQQSTRQQMTRALSTSLLGGSGCGFMPQLQQRLERRPTGNRKIPEHPCTRLMASSSVDERESDAFERRMIKDIAAASSLSGYRRPSVQWYPGHIAKAERQLKDSFLKAVDVVVEVRDARIPKATSHPKVGRWCAGRPRLVVLTHADQVPNACAAAWKDAYEIFGETANKPVTEQESGVDGQVINQARQAAAERAKYEKGKTMNEEEQDKQDEHGNNNNSPNYSNFQVAPVLDVLFVNAKEGSGIPALQRAIFKAGAYVQERRARRGLKGRALRVGVLGYPNVGKSAVINRLLKRRRAKSSNTPGVTRSLQWIRVRSNTPDRSGAVAGTDKEFELLDSPGIIPLSLSEEQSDAILLAACNCIGENSYDNQAVAAYLCEWMLALHRLGHAQTAAPGWKSCCMERYKFDPLQDVEIVRLQPSMYEDEPTHRTRTGEDMLFNVADNTCQGDLEDASRKILQDFRSGRMGPICLQLAPQQASDPGQVPILKNDEKEERERIALLAYQQQQERAVAARQAAAEMGLELPPVLLEQERRQQQEQEEKQQHAGEQQASEDVGKGLFDGW